MIEAITILSSLVSLLLIVLAILLNKIRRLKNSIKKLSVAYSKIEDLVSSKHQANSGVHEENFIKFLSDSRDSAFNYIEEVQSGLAKFVNDIEPEIKYFKEYGSPMAIQPNYYSMKKVVEAYTELKQLLPGENK